MALTWQWGVLVPLAIAVFTDLRAHKIPNWLTLPTLGVGLLLAFTLGGVPALGRAVLGAGEVFAPAFVLFALRGLKGGDVKMLAATGAWMGSSLALPAILFGWIAWGACAVVYMVAKGLAPAVYRNVVTFATTLQASGYRPSGFKMANDGLVASKTHFFPLAIGLFAGCALALAFPHLVR